MLKAVTSLLIAGAAALAIASPASATPVCADGPVNAYGSYGNATAYVDINNYCTTDQWGMEVTATDYPFTYYGIGTDVLQLYDLFGGEVVEITVSDDTGTDSFYVTVYWTP